MNCADPLLHVHQITEDEVFHKMVSLANMYIMNLVAAVEIVILVLQLLASDLLYI